MLITKRTNYTVYYQLFYHRIQKQTKNQKLGQLAQDKRELDMKFEIASILNRCTTELSLNKDINLAINNLLQIVNEYFYERTFYILLKYFADCASNLHQDHSDKESYRGK